MGGLLDRPGYFKGVENFYANFFFQFLSGGIENFSQGVGIFRERVEI